MSKEVKKGVRGNVSVYKDNKEGLEIKSSGTRIDGSPRLDVVKNEWYGGMKVGEAELEQGAFGPTGRVILKDGSGREISRVNADRNAFEDISQGSSGGGGGGSSSGSSNKSKGSSRSGSSGGSSSGGGGSSGSSGGSSGGGGGSYYGGGGSSSNVARTQSYEHNHSSSGEEWSGGAIGWGVALLFGIFGFFVWNSYEGNPEPERVSPKPVIERVVSSLKPSTSKRDSEIEQVLAKAEERGFDVDKALSVLKRDPPKMERLERKVESTPAPKQEAIPRAQEGDSYHNSYVLGRHFEEMGMYKDAIEYYNQASDNNTHHLEAIKRVRTLVGRHGKRLNLKMVGFQAVPIASEIPLEERIVRADILEAERISDKGYRFFRRREVDKAIRSYESSLNLNRENPITWFRLGLALEKDRNYDGALNAFNKAIKLDRDYEEARTSRSDLVEDHWKSMRIDNHSFEYSMYVKK
jgi:tetratricopeptide (TPR) repeat protein